jgi:putative membrane protein
MIHILNEQERGTLDRRVVEVENRTGAQFVLAVIHRSDTYAELPWKAFALGAAAAGLGAVLIGLPRSEWHTGLGLLMAMVAVLATGAAGALLCIAVPGFARPLLDAHRAEVEVRQYAESLFLSREVFTTRDRMGVLMLISLFERHVVVLPDRGLAKRLGNEALQDIVSRMTKDLAVGQIGRALETGLQGLEEKLVVAGPTATRENELPNAIIEEDGR